MQEKLLVKAGEMKASPALSQKMGPLGINLGKIIADVNKATQEHKGIRVPVLLDIDTKTRSFTIKVLTAPTSELLKQEIKLEKGSPQAGKIKIGNIALEQAIKIAKIKQPELQTELKESVKTVVGTCVSIGMLVESKDPKEVLEEINQGKYDEIINKGLETPSPEKLEKLASDFEQVKKDQEAFVKKLEAKEKPEEAVSEEAKPEEKAVEKEEPKKEVKKEKKLAARKRK